MLAREEALALDDAVVLAREAPALDDNGTFVLADCDALMQRP